MFFPLSKYLWTLVDPANLLLVLLVAGVLLSASRWRKAGLRVLMLVAMASVVIATVPVSAWGLWLLENRFPVMTVMPPRVDGIIVAGGILDPRRSRDRGQPVLGGAVERLTAMAQLAHRYPDAQVIFSGGAGDPAHPQLREAHYIAPFLADMGLEAGRVLFEDTARNTAENARITHDIARPQPGQTWLLVTSAFHMPRAIGTFRQAGWDIQAYPVDFSTSPGFVWQFFFNFSAGIMQLSQLTHEVVGLIVYKLSGRSRSFFPGP